MNSDFFNRITKIYLRRAGFFRLSLKTRFTILAVILAQGAPLGYLLIKYLVLPKNPNPLTHALILIESETWVVTYMCLGTTFFFALFGRSLGMKADQLKSSNEYLQHSLRQSQSFELMRKKFMLNLMDEVRTPISMALEFLRGHNVGFWGIPPARQRELSTITIEELTRLDEILKTMLELKNLKQLGLEHRSETSLHKLVSDIFSSFKKNHPARELTLHSMKGDSDPGLVNRELLQLAIEHLLKNSLQYSNSSPIALSLAKIKGNLLKKDSQFKEYGERIDKSLSYFVIAVEDKGPGIKESIVQQVFEPFFGSYLFDGQKKSLGLGLTLVRDVAEWHGGFAFIESKENQGTKAIIVIPVYAALERLRRAG